MGVSTGVTPPAATPQPRITRDHKFHPLRVRDVIAETADTGSVVLEIPHELRDAFAYRAGQFVTLRVTISGERHLRSYSMSSSPDVDDDFRVTVKRVPGGAVSNWILDHIGPGDVIETTCPAGHFCLGPDERDIITLAGGSGITPVISLLKSALETTRRKVRLVYANRDEEAIIFSEALRALDRRYPGRLDVVHHLDVEHGYVDRTMLLGYLRTVDDADYFICGPEPFMALVEQTLLEHAINPARIHIERFTPRAQSPEPSGPTDTVTVNARVTVELDGRTETTEHRPGTTLLQTARQAGLKPPSSCEAGDCATCMARLVEGSATMKNNNALTDDEVAEGWVLTCQAVPDSPEVRVVYGYDD